MRFIIPILLIIIGFLLTLIFIGAFAIGYKENGIFYRDGSWIIGFGAIALGIILMFQGNKMRKKASTN